MDGRSGISLLAAGPGRRLPCCRSVPLRRISACNSWKTFRTVGTTRTPQPTARPVRRLRRLRYVPRWRTSTREDIPLLLMRWLTRSPSATRITAFVCLLLTETATTCGAATWAMTARATARALDNAEKGYDRTTLSRAPRAGGRCRGRSTRTSARPGCCWRLGFDVSNPYIGNYGDNLAVVLRQAPWRLTGRCPGTDVAGCVPVPRSPRVSRSFAILREDVPAGPFLVGLMDRGTASLYTEHPSRPPTMAPGTFDGVLDVLTANPGVEQDRAVHHLRRITTAFRSRGAAVCAVSARAGIVDGDHGGRALSGRQWIRRRWLRTGCSRTDAGRVALEQGRLGLFANLRPPPDHPLPGTAFAAREPNIFAFGAALLAAISPRLRLHGTMPTRRACSARLVTNRTRRIIRICVRRCRPTSACPGRSRDNDLPVRRSYALDVQGRVDVAAGRYRLQFVNQGRSGAFFHVFSPGQDRWSLGIHGGSRHVARRRLDQLCTAASPTTSPSRDRMDFSANSRAASPRWAIAAVTPSSRYAWRQVGWSTFTPGHHQRRLRHVRGDGHAGRRLHPPAAAPLPPATRWSRREPMGDRPSDHWFDFSVTSDLTIRGSWWRLAGHRETGRASRTDLALGTVVTR